MALFAVLLLAFTQALSGQSLSLERFNHDRLARSRSCMWVLGGWGAANLISGAVGMAATDGSARAFHQMNLAWGAVNLGIALPGLLRRRKDTGAPDLYGSIKALQQTEKVFLFNAGLDFGYIASGLWLQERAKNLETHPERWRGFGRSIVLQGAFLLVFDVSSWYAHHRLESRIPPFFEQIKLGFDGREIGLVWRF